MRAAANRPSGNPFDRSLELRELRDAAEVYASRHGEPGSAAYRTAWLRFRQHVKSVEDLQRLRAAAAHAKAAAETPRRPRRSSVTRAVAAKARGHIAVTKV